MAIKWIDRVRNEEVLLWVKEDRNILHIIKRRKADWVCYILRRNCLLKHVIDGKIQLGIEVTRRKGRKLRSCWMTLRQGEGTGNWKRKHCVAPCGELALEEAIDLS
jgi:hypothetical protein